MRTPNNQQFYAVVSYDGKVSYFCELSLRERHEANFAVVQQGDCLVVWKDRYHFVEKEVELTPAQAHVMVGAHLLVATWKDRNPTAGPDDLKKAAIVAAKMIRDAGGIELSDVWRSVVDG